MDRRRFFFRVLVLVGLCLLPSACAHRAQPSDAQAADALPELILARLLIAREVAVTKHYSGAPVHDPVREAALLSELTALGRARGLPPETVEPFLAAQIAASRRVQEELLDAWRAGRLRPEHPPLDLRRDLRPRLDALNAHFLEALAAPRAPDVLQSTSRGLAYAGFSPEVIALATAPLRP